MLGEVADLTSIRFVYIVCSFLPAVGLLAALLPNIEPSSLADAAVGTDDRGLHEGETVANDGVLL